MLESREISTKIEDIIAMRRARRPLLDKRIQDIDAAIAAVKEILALKDSVMDKNGELLTDSPYYSIFADNPKLLNAIGRVLIPESLLADMQMLQQEYENLSSRFHRDFINIAVVGPARQGKSRLLQSISGLDGRCIPAFDGDHCTGASSTIENGTNTHVRVHLTYKTKEEVLEEVQGYLDIISNKSEHIYNIDDLPDYTMERLEAMLDKVDKNKANATAKKNILYVRYIQHYSEWRDLIGRAPEWKENEDEIMTYVAQHNGLEQDAPGFRRYFKFVGVRMARIIKAFSYSDAGKIKLVDTVGLGDTSVDTQEKMLQTIKTDSDAVVFFKFPNAVTGGTPLDEEITIFDKVRSMFENRRMEKWFIFLLNHSKENPECRRYDNIGTCRSFKEAMDSGKYLPVLMNQIVDVTDSQEVREQFLVPMLKALASNLKEIDQMFANELEPKAVKVWRGYDALCKSVEGLIKCSVGGNLTNDIYQLIKKTYDGDMMIKLRDLNQRCGEKRNEKCEILCSQIDNITDTLMEKVPDEAVIQEYIDSHGVTFIAEVYKHFIDVLRSDITQSFIEVDTSLQPMVMAFKNEIATILAENGRLGRILPPSKEKEIYEWMQDFADMHLENDTQLQRAFHFLYEFDFSVRGALMHEVRKSLYEISLANPNMMSVSFNNASAKSVVFKLKVALKRVQDNLKNALKDFYMSPNAALFAVLDEFFDRISTSEGVYDEWFQLYSSFAGRIWSQELMASEKNGSVIASWADDIETLHQYNRKDSFVLSLE